MLNDKVEHAAEPTNNVAVPSWRAGDACERPFLWGLLVYEFAATVLLALVADSVVVTRFGSRDGPSVDPPFHGRTRHRSMFAQRESRRAGRGQRPAGPDGAIASRRTMLGGVFVG